MNEHRTPPPPRENGGAGKRTWRAPRLTPLEQPADGAIIATGMGNIGDPKDNLSAVEGMGTMYDSANMTTMYTHTGPS